MSTDITWPKIERHARERIEELRSSLEAAPADAVPALQAEIRVWRQVLDLPVTLARPSAEPIGSGYF